MIRPLLFLAATLIALAPPDAARAADAKPDCSVPPELIQDDPTMPALAQDFAKKSSVNIVVIGGASTAGKAAGADGDNAYPHFLQLALARHHPGVPITVLNKGVARQTALDMTQRFAKDATPGHPALVIWETGTVDAVRGAELDDFAQTLSDGIATLRDQKAEVMLVDMQYDPRTAAVINFEPYLEVMRRTAGVENVYLFRRYDIMKHWDDAGIFAVEDTPKGKNAALAGEIYRCLGDSMADAIDFAAR